MSYEYKLTSSRVSQSVNQSDNQPLVAIPTLAQELLACDCLSVLHLKRLQTTDRGMRHACICASNTVLMTLASLARLFSLSLGRFA